MFEIVGKYNQATVYAATVDSEAYAQVLRMCNREELKDCRIRMMPDMHAAEVKDILTPLYNFKASSTAAPDEETRDGEN